MEEVFVNGFAISDTHLISSVKRKLTPDMWKQLWNDAEKELGGS